jgi:hypothetical protein
VNDIRRDGDPDAGGRPMSTADLADSSGTRPDDRHSDSDVPADDAATAPLLAEDEAGDLRRHWEQIQGGFVDEPRRAVEEADQLVAAAMKRLAEVFATERSQLEGQWDRGDDVSTEDLRVALRRYRSFFERLLSV